MLTKIRILSIAAIFISGCASNQLAIEQDSTFVVRGENRAAIHMAALDENGSVQLVDSGTAREGVVEYFTKEVHWPTATIKEIKFTRNGGGVLYPITDETTIYVLNGRISTTVRGKPTVLNKGDVASLPEGALRDIDKPTDATVIAWTAPSLEIGAPPAISKFQDAKEAVVANGLLRVRRYEFPGNSVRAVTLEQGLETNPGIAKTDSLIYLTEGILKFNQDGKEFTVKKGDFIREVAGIYHFWNVIENSAFVTTSGLPLGADPIDPNEATDIPE
jgi:quercetin dioxygenase-like cupin family protein